MLTQKLITVTAAFRILSAKLSEFGQLVFVEKLKHIRGKLYNAVYRFRCGGKISRCACFIGLKQFEESFTTFRKENTANLLIEPQSDCWEFKVYNTSKMTEYKVETRHPSITCQCPDYENQLRRYGRSQEPVCKHGYAVLSFLGFASINDYLKNYTGPGDADIDRIQTDRYYDYWEQVADARAALGF